MVRDAYGTLLQDGDSVTVIKDLKIKGSSSVVKVGTSMGAVVGGLYASGMSADEIAQGLGALEWGEMFVDRLDRRREVAAARRLATAFSERP